MISADDLSPAQLAALLHFHADAGVDWMLEDEAVDRFAEFEAQKAARRAAPPAQRPQQTALPRQNADQPTQAPDRGVAARSEPPPAPAVPQDIAVPQDMERTARMGALPSTVARQVSIPDEQAIAQAERVAASATTLAQLRSAMDEFTGCNLKNSARNLVFLQGAEDARVMIIGPMPNADDDRDGLPFAGRQGEMLDRMLAGIALKRDDLALTNVIPWRPPGNRTPSPREVEICRPFILRQIALVEPQRLLILGNFAARFFFGGQDTIHNMRGVWRDISVSNRVMPAMATLHPQDLVSAPVSKRLAWSDILMFKAAIQT